MPVPSAISDLDPNPVNNSPPSNESVGPDANAYLQAAFAFIKQLAGGAIAPIAALSMKSYQINFLAAGTANTDAVNLGQLKAINKVGDQKMWHGAVANIAAVQGPGWQLADGTNGTADCRDKFIVGAGLTYAPGAVGGAASIALSVAQMPNHNHALNDPLHNHSISQTPHGHSINDPSHNHGSDVGGFVGPLAGSGTIGSGGVIGTTSTTQNAGTGISINSEYANVSNVASGTGITIASAGSGSAITILPPYYASCILEYTGIGV